MDVTPSKSQWMKASELATIQASLEKVMETYQGKTKRKVFL